MSRPIIIFAFFISGKGIFCHKKARIKSKGRLQILLVHKTEKNIINSNNRHIFKNDSWDLHDFTAMTETVKGFFLSLHKLRVIQWPFWPWEVESGDSFPVIACGAADAYGLVAWNKSIG